MPTVRSMDVTLAIRRIASGIGWVSVAEFVVVCLVDLEAGHYHAALTPLLLLFLVLACLSVKDSIERWVDAQAGKAIAERMIAELTLKATEDAVRAGQYRVTVHWERARAVN